MEKEEITTNDYLKGIVLNLPDSPGIYQYLNSEGTIIYVGKAKNLKRRVSSYFNREHPNGKTRLLVSKIADIRYIVVKTEEDALLLENNLIKKYKPRYNVLLKDDKTYPSICVSNEYFPRIFKTRQVIRNGSSYYGPYSHMPSMLAVMDYMHEWNSGHLFVGVRNVNEDFFTSDVTALFQNSSEGIFPTVASSYPIANYPYSGLTLYFDVTKGKWTFRNSLYNGVGYNGWKAHDNPFLVRPKKDGIFNMSQLEYEHKGGKYFAGAAVHTRQYPINEDGEMVSADESKGKTTCGWWIYGEQSVWKAGDKNISCMVQYSENTSHQNACYRYAELGGAYQDEKNECGLSGQYARFQQGSEYSLEVTWKRQLTESISLQPSFQYIKNDNGDFTALSARLYVSF